MERRARCWVPLALLLSLVSGTVTGQDPTEYTIETVVGTGVAGFNGDGRPGTETQTNPAREVCYAPDGCVYFADEESFRVRKLRPDGVVEAVAGNGTEGYSGDGGPATAAQISKPRGIAVDEDGNVYFADAWNQAIRRVDPDGIIDTVVGTGVEGYNGDGLPPRNTQINRPNDVAIGPDGLLYFSGRNHRIRRVNEQNRVETVAGNGEEAYGGDFGPATSASLNSPSGITFTSEGVLIIADEDNHRIREVRDGIIRTIVGTGEAAMGGDNIPPLQARFRNPRDVTVGPDDTIYIADTENHRIGMVRPGENFRVLAGNGSAAYSGDGGPSRLARLNEPKGVTVSPDGVVYVGDTGNFVVRAILPPTVGERFIRGDVDVDGRLTIGDPVYILNWLFGTLSMSCEDAADVDDLGSINITDPIVILRYLFMGDAPPAAPFPECGPDPTPGDPFGCDVGDACPEA
jgi:sugar lactone lactonase YvrE